MKTQEKLTPEIIWQMFAETDRRFKETDKRLDKRFKETTDAINQMRGHFDKQLGKLVEALIQYNTIDLFKEKGIKITHSQPNPERIFENINMEFDLMLLNDTELVIVEAKVSLNKQKVYKFKKKIENFKLFFKEFKLYKVHACLAFITSKSEARELAEENGFYLLKLKDEKFMEFGNTQEFKPILY